jgi:hypothetical protein
MLKVSAPHACGDGGGATAAPSCETTYRVPPTVKLPVRNCAVVFVSALTFIAPLPTGLAGVVVTIIHGESLLTVHVQVVVEAVTITGQFDSAAPE